MKYDLRYYAECFVGDVPSRRTLLHARTLAAAKEEAERRFPLHAPGDMSRCRLDQLRRKGRFGEAIRFSGKYFLLRASVEAFAERRMRYREYWENRARMRRERLARRASG